MTPCGHKSCRVRNARWRVYTDARAPYGERWRSIRVFEGWWCRTHAQTKVRQFNYEEKARSRTISLEMFLEMFGGEAA